MQVLDRYLAAVARHLPKAEAADITAELRENLLSEIEEKEAELGRKLEPRELDALLIGFGHPLTVAARFGKARYLIGPEIYPFWIAALRVVFGIFVAFVLVGLVIAAVTSGLPNGRTAGAAAQLWPAALALFGAVTLVFAVMERAWNGRMKLKWSPRQLPPPRTPGRKPGELISEIVAQALFILWWVGVIHIRAPVPPFIQVHLAPIWAEMHWIILAFASAQIVFNTLELLRPGWVRLNAALGLAYNLVGCVILYQVLQAGHWIDVDASVPRHALESMRRGFDTGMQIGLIITVLMLAGKAIWDLGRLVRGQRGDALCNGIGQGLAGGAPKANA